jgi:hypothetical protein
LRAGTGEQQEEREPGAAEGKETPAQVSAEAPAAEAAVAVAETGE